MEIKAISSGSKGNAYYISDGETQLLIECGVTMKKLRGDMEFPFQETQGILISHHHSDHCKAIQKCREAGAEIYAPADVYAYTKTEGERCHAVTPFRAFTVGTFTILAFDLQHDCVNYGYLITSRSTGERLLYFTDTYMVKYRFPGLTHIMAECNYSLSMLRQNVHLGLTPLWLKDRIKVSHMSIEHLEEFFKANDLADVKKLYLIHLSENNGNANVFRRRIRKVTGKDVEILN